MIRPTVGRVLHYWPTPAERSFQHDQPFRADICHVWGDTCVNLAINAENGKLFTRDSVILAQDRAPAPGECSWMDYQVAQAKNRAFETQHAVAALPPVPGILTDPELNERMAARGYPRVTEASINEVITSEAFFEHETLTICVLTLRNSFKVVGESACVDPRNYDAAVGRTYARKDAMRKIWPLEGYALSERMRISTENR